MFLFVLIALTHTCTELRQNLFILLWFTATTKSQKNILLSLISLLRLFYFLHLSIFTFFSLPNENKRVLIYFSNIKVYSNVECIFSNKPLPCTWRFLCFPKGQGCPCCESLDKGTGKSCLLRSAATLIPSKEDLQTFRLECLLSLFHHTVSGKNVEVGGPPRAL